LFFLTTPNAPLGCAVPLDYIAEVAQRCSGLLVVDEAYVDFAECSALELVKSHANVVVTRTFSKSYSLAGDASRPGGGPPGDCRSTRQDP